jgi:putative SOS response-associated peptidase YedK
MCSDYRLRAESDAMEALIAALDGPMLYPEGRPNIEPRDDVRITDRSAIVRAAAGAPGAYEMVQRRWSWPAPGGKPVYNFRSDGREFSSGRCVILADGFYEFTAPADPKAKRKHKWLFTLRGAELFGIAGLWRSHPQVGEAFTMLTAPPGPDIAPYHDRQIVVLPPADLQRWLDASVAAAEVLRPLPAGSLDVAQIC